MENNLPQALFGRGLIETHEPPPRLVFLTWNIDGLEERNLKRRMAAVVELIRGSEPDVVFLQEVIEEIVQYLDRKLPEYKLLRGNEEGYFTVTLLRVFTVKYDFHYVEPFTESQMGRNLLITRAHIGQRHFVFINTHLESGAEASAERKNQLRTAFEVADRFPSEVTAIVGGDFNLREAEADIPGSYKDAWIASGSRKEARWTWDTQRNTNKGFGSKGPRARFDRVYIRGNPAWVTLQDFFLVGAQHAPGTQMFPSDHWGILICLKLRH